MSKTHAPASQDKERARHEWSVLAVCSIAVMVVQIDATAVNLALPSISRQMHAATSELQWVVDAYLLVLASLLMFSGSLGDRIGRKRVLMGGLILFGLGSALCSVSVNAPMLVAMRALQGVGGSALAPVALSIITNTFEDARRRAQAIGVWGAVVGVGMATGPLIGGALVDAIDWRSVFWINLPVVALGLWLVHRVVDESRAEHPSPVDVPGQLLAVATLGSLTFAIIEGGEHEFTAPRVLVAAAVAAVCLAAFVRMEKRSSGPLLPLEAFRSMPFTLATVMAMLAFFAYAGFVFVATLYLQDYRNMEPLDAGLATMPMAVANGALAPLSGYLVGKVGARPPMVVASVLSAGGAVALLLLGPDASLGHFIAAGVLVGAGLGLVNSPITNTAVSGMPRSKAGVAGATASTARQLGQSLGVAVLGAMLNDNLKDGQVFTTAARPGWGVLLAVAVLVCVLAMVSGTARAQSTSRAVAADA